MAGAIALAGMAAVRSGAGLVRLAVPDCCVETVAGYSPCYMVVPLPSDAQGMAPCVNDGLVSWIEQSDCIAIGPGLGRSENVTNFFLDVLQVLRDHNPNRPLVVDADALIALGSQDDWPEAIENPYVLTPHPGEWQKLCKISAGDRQRQEDAAIRMAAEHDFTIALKGHRTLVTDGDQTSRNDTGTPAMATGGSGDVLTGIITALICQGMPWLDATQLAVHVHGLAGQIAEAATGSHVVPPTELMDYLPSAFAQCKA